MLLRLFAILLLLPRLGFRAAVHAEWLAWMGALLINGIAYGIVAGRYMVLDRVRRR
ncbi:MAG: hypothetical protein IKC28_00070 [Clostridia bacterium]|nr:hypothetical protein [Clostridia bacterium]